MTLAKIVLGIIGEKNSLEQRNPNSQPGGKPSEAAATIAESLQIIAEQSIKIYCAPGRKITDKGCCEQCNVSGREGCKYFQEYQKELEQQRFTERLEQAR